MSTKQLARRRRERLDCRYDAVGELGDPCVYCGVLSSNWDHVPPLCAAEALNDVDIDLLSLRKIPACRECNSFLGAYPVGNIRERRKYILERIQRKYGLYLRMPQWDEDELSELSVRMADDIRRSSQFATYIKQRAAWARTGGRL